jgi:hypothetical protein
MLLISQKPKTLRTQEQSRRFTAFPKIPQWKEGLWSEEHSRRALQKIGSGHG